MKIFFTSVTAAFLLCAVGTAVAKGDYNDVSVSDPQYVKCISYTKANYEGGSEKSPIKGQNKAQAYCECMWNETPDDFKGSLAKFGETSKGKKINAICEKYSDWGS